jgi:hypothetical protein
LPRRWQAVLVKGKNARRGRRPAAARSAYEVRVIDIANERHFGQGLVLLLELGFGATGVGGLSGDSLSGVTVELVDRRNDAVLLSWRLLPDNAHAMVTRIEAGLDRLNAQEFAKEWGIATRAVHE